MRQELESSVASAVKKLFDLDIEVSLTRPEEKFGDYASNVALRLAKDLGQNPRDIATELASELEKLDSLEKVGVAGAGFINLTLTDKYLASALEQDDSTSLAGRKILVEYSDPNPLKPLHAGHLYTTLVGDTIARLIENAGAETIRLNYGGDVGRHIGISLWAIIRELGGENPDKLAEISATERAAWLGNRYVEGTSAFEDDERAKQEITEMNKRVYELQANNDRDSPFAQIYWIVRQWSYDYFTTLYDQLQVHPFDRFIPESEVFQLGVTTVREQLAKGVYSESQGAVVFEGEPFGLHTRVFINSAGLPTYETKDVGLLLTKWQDYHFDESIVITANEQTQYYQVMLKSVEQYAPEPVERSKHLTHGVVKLQGGVKMSSRKGNIVTALEILEAAREAGRETDTNPSEDTILAAVKYAFAKNRIGGDIAYDPKESIALEGNSGPYLQYAHARAKSILAKSNSEKELTFKSWGKNDFEADERSLARKISEYPEIIELATNELMPHHICTYLYELAQTFNRFYEKNRVLGDARESIRLALLGKYAETLKRGLNLLGIVAPEKM